MAASSCVEVRAPAAEAELAADALWAAGATAVEERAEGHVVVLVAGFAGRAEAAAARDRLSVRWPATAAEVADAGWAEAWRAWARPVRAGRLVVHPAWVPPPGPAPGDVVVAVEPARSFGTGSHPSTSLLLAELERRLQGGERVLDVGSGSGVLAVAAAALGAGEVVAVDVDPHARRTTLSNATRNRVGDRVVAVAHVSAAIGPFDVVVVNLGGTRAVLGLAPLLARCTRPGGVLAVSGLLAGSERPVASAFGSWERVAVPRDGEWVAVVLRRPERG